MAFVVIQHPDPTHESLMAELIGRDTTMTVVQAGDGMPIERNRVYVIPPRAFLGVEDGVLRLSEPVGRHGTPLPFDFFLRSLAFAHKERAVCVILSGTGSDGSVGLKSVSENGGLVIAQDPTDAAYDGMPRRAIATGAVNMVLPAAEIPQALIRYARHPDPAELEHELENTRQELESTIHELKTVEAATRLARACAEAVIDTVNEPLIVLDGAMHVVSASRSFYRYIGASPEDTLGRALPDTDARHLAVPALCAFLDHVKAQPHGPQNCEIEIELPVSGRRTLIVRAEQIRDEGTGTRRTLLSFNDITNYRRAEQQAAAAQQVAEQANLAKSRFLAAVSHDLRQPLQTLTFLHDALQGEVTGEKGKELLGRAEVTLDSMAGMLNALLNVNQLETGTIRPQVVDFPINDLLDRLDHEFAHHAAQRGLGWRVVRCGLAVRSDPHLLDQMVRNLLSNAIRYTEKGEVLLGCRHRGDRLRIEVWDTGVGIAREDIPKIFDEYHQAPGQTGAVGLGLGLAIVQRLGELLEHPIDVRSRVGRGSVFAIEMPLGRPPRRRRRARTVRSDNAPARGDAILVIEDEPTLRNMLVSALTQQGYRTAAAGSGSAALALVIGNGFRPDLVVSDYALPGGMNGAETAAALHTALGREIPVVFLTGDIRAASLREITIPNSVRLSKPVKPAVLGRAIRRYLTAEPPSGAVKTEPAATAAADAPATVFVVDDDAQLRDAFRALLTQAGYHVESFASGEELVDADLSGRDVRGKACLIADVRLPGVSGFELLARLASAGTRLPAIIITGHGDVAMAVEAMRAGAVDFIEKPVRGEELLAAIDRALRVAANPSEETALSTAAAMRIAGLTPREREVMGQVVDGLPNKEIAARFGISQRTIETHRAAVMRKMGAGSLSELVRLVLAARSATPA